VDLNDVQPVIVRSPALLADKDPYNSARAVIKATPAPAPEPSIAESPEAEKRTEKLTPETGAPIMKAIPVTPEEEKPLEIRKAQPVGPLDEVKDRTLLKSATPPPTSDPDE
jgi:hypothetical protein